MRAALAIIAVNIAALAGLAFWITRTMRSIEPEERR